MDFDDPKVYGNTSISDGLVRMWNTQNTTFCPCTIALYVRKHYINSNVMIFAFYVHIVRFWQRWLRFKSKYSVWWILHPVRAEKFYFQSHLSLNFAPRNSISNETIWKETKLCIFTLCKFPFKIEHLRMWNKNPSQTYINFHLIFWNHAVSFPPL